MKTNKITDKELSNFTKTMASGFESFKKEIKNNLTEIAKQRGASDMKMFSEGDKEFTFTNELIYLGGKDLEKEKQMANELAELMKKYKIVKCRAELFKNF